MTGELRENIKGLLSQYDSEDPGLQIWEGVVTYDAKGLHFKPESYHFVRPIEC